MALALIPEAIAFSIIAGVDPAVGLYASVIIAVTISLVGGRPAMISAATGAMALLMVGLVRDHGLEYLFAASILCGLFQIVIGLLKLGRYIKFVSRSVMTGFVNSLAILIFMAQMPELIGADWPTFALVAAGLAVIYGLPRLTRAVPSALVAIILLSGFVIWTGLDVRTVGDMGQMPSILPIFHLPMVPLTWETFVIIAPVSATLAFVGLLESLLTANLIDDITDTPSDKDRETRGQGHRQHRVGLLRRHGGLRHDRPVDDQRHLRRARPALDPMGRPFPAVPDPGPSGLGRAHSHGGLGGDHDHGLRRDL